LHLRPPPELKGAIQQRAASKGPPFFCAKPFAQKAHATTHCKTLPALARDQAFVGMEQRVDLGEREVAQYSP
jgi:hypothetical protein